MEFFYTLDMKDFRNFLDAYQEKIENRARETDAHNYILGKYVAIAVNDPKKYPKKPFLEKEKGVQKEDTHEGMKRVLDGLVGLTKGKKIKK